MSSKRGLLFLLLLPLITSTSENKSPADAEKRVQYILYDVNPGEGFNLRRDVYMRMAVFVKKLNKAFPQSYWVLVLPPWGHLYHWQSRQLGHQVRIPWATFFDLESLGHFVPVVEFHDWKKTTGGELGAVYYLQGYKEGWKDGKFEEKFDLRECLQEPRYEQRADGLWEGEFFFHEGVVAKHFACLSVQGHTSVLADFVKEQSVESIMLDRAENLLHDWFGDVEYWGARRSMRFAKHLVERADQLRRDHLDSDDTKDGTVVPKDWREERVGERSPKGGKFACVHLRRGDYARGRGSRAPTIKGAAEQVGQALTSRGLETLFVATDADLQEWQRFKKGLQKFKVVRFDPSKDELKNFGDGGVAIIDQAVCRHAQYFIGTKDSTFTFRIQEEREVRGFPLADTFDMLCPEQGECERGTEWKIDWGKRGHKFELPNKYLGKNVREEL